MIGFDDTGQILCAYPSNTDSDGDGITDDLDLCPDTTGIEINEDGCTLDQLDSDGDGITDDVDTCKTMNDNLLHPWSQLMSANLSGCYLSNVNLMGSNMYGADLSGAYLSGANLSSVALVNADLSGADLSDANLSGAILTNADLSGATLTGADLTDVNWNNTTCPDGTNTDTNSDGTCVGHEYVP